MIYYWKGAQTRRHHHHNATTLKICRKFKLAVLRYFDVSKKSLTRLEECLHALEEWFGTCTNLRKPCVSIVVLSRPAFGTLGPRLPVTRYL